MRVYQFRHPGVHAIIVYSVKNFLTLLLILLPFFFVPVVTASSQQAYQDYQYQFDLYRSRLSDYQIAIDQYNQFKSLAAQQDALDKVKLFIAQRDMVGKTYFLFLNEKLNENPGLTSADKAVYRAILTNQIAFLDQNAVQSPSIASLDDAKQISGKFETNYETMQSAYRQIISSIQLGYLNYFAARFESSAVHAQALINASRKNITPEKQTVLDRWLLALSNKRSLYQQKANAIRTLVAKITGDVQQQDRLFNQVQNNIYAARQDIVEAVSYLKEIEIALTYD